MKVLHVIRSLHIGGGERICIDICKELQKKKEINSLLLVVLDKTNEFLQETKDLNIIYCNSKVRPSILKKSFIDTDEFDRIVQKFKPDIIHSHLFWAELTSRQKTYSSVKYFTHCHNEMLELKRFNYKTIFSKDKITRYFERLWMINKYKSCNNKFICISKENYNYFMKNLPLFRNRLKLLPNAIDSGKFYFERSYEKKIDLKIINIGRFESYKNQKFLVQIIYNLNQKGFNVKATFLGEGPELEKTIKLSEELKISQNIKFKGNISNVPKELKKNTIFVHTAFHEPFGLVMLEAMASGLPVVALDSNGSREFIKNNINGFIVKKQNIELFSSIILKLFSDKNFYERISRSAQTTSKKYDIKEYSKKLLNIYKDNEKV